MPQILHSKIRAGQLKNKKKEINTNENRLELSDFFLVVHSAQSYK